MLPKNIEVEVDDKGTKNYYNLNCRQLDRNDGPAVEYADGGKLYYKNGQLHNESGPAIQWANGDRYYFLNDVEVSEETVRNLGKMK